MSDLGKGVIEQSRRLATPETEDWFTRKCRDPEFVKEYLEEHLKMAAEEISFSVPVGSSRSALKCKSLEVIRKVLDAQREAIVKMLEGKEFTGHSTGSKRVYGAPAAVRAQGEKQ